MHRRRRRGGRAPLRAPRPHGRRRRAGRDRRAVRPRATTSRPTTARSAGCRPGSTAGSRTPSPRASASTFRPGHGELLELPIYSHDGFATALLFENVPGGALEPLAHVATTTIPPPTTGSCSRRCAGTTRWPPSASTPTPSGLWSGRDLLQGALTPIVREDYARLSSGRYALAMGDAHTVVDPMMGQGANSASYSAWTIGEAIVADHVYDERFCERVARRREGFVHGVSDWTNLMLNPPPHVLEFIGAMARTRRCATSSPRTSTTPSARSTSSARPSARARTSRRAGRPRGGGGDMHRLLTLYPPPSDARPSGRITRAITCRSSRACPACGATAGGSTLAAVGGGDSPYFCVFAADFDDAPALDAALGSPEGEAIAADVPNYATGGVILLLDVLDGELKGLGSSVVSLFHNARLLICSARLVCKADARLPPRDTRRVALATPALGVPAHRNEDEYVHTAQEAVGDECSHDRPVAAAGRSRRGLGLVTLGDRAGIECCHCARRNPDGDRRSWDVTDVGDSGRPGGRRLYGARVLRDRPSQPVHGSGRQHVHRPLPSSTAAIRTARG